MKNKNEIHKCKNCGKTYTPYRNGADDMYGPECVKKFILKEIEDLENQQIKVSVPEFLADKQLNAKKIVEDQIDNSQREIEIIDKELKTETIPEMKELLQDNKNEIMKETNELNKLMLSLQYNVLSIKDLFKAIHNGGDSVSQFATAIFIAKYADKISHRIVLALPEHAKLSLARNVKTTRAALNYMAEQNDNLWLKRAAKSTLLIKKEMKG